MEQPEYFVHSSAVVDEGASIGEGSSVWHFSHLMPKAVIGKGCSIGQGCYIANVVIGDRVRIQNHVSVYDGVTLEDDVFCGPSCVFTNVLNPRSEVQRKEEYRPTLVKRGASIGANATIVCGATIGEYAFVGAGAVVRGVIPDRAIVVGVPAEQIGWMCDCGERLVLIAKETSSTIYSEKVRGVGETAAKAGEATLQCTVCNRFFRICAQGAESVD